MGEGTEAWPALPRRSVLALGAGVLLTGCSAGTPSGSSSPSPRASPRASAGPVLPAPARWRASPGDLSPRAKLAAVRTIERRGTSARSRVHVLDAQYGGLLTAAASVLVVCRTWTAHAGAVHEGGATYDVRLTRGATGWWVTEVRPSRPGPARRLTAEERAVLAERRIVLPPAAQADVRSGQVHPTVLVAMLRLSQRYRIGVSVVRSGHPIHVFGTDRLSDHPQGRAFDTFRVDGHLVVAPRTPRRLVAGFMEAAAAAGAYNVGGPYLLGAAPQFFSDGTHHDHVHAGFAT